MTAPLDDHNWQVPAYEVYNFMPRQHDYCICIPIINEGERIRKQLGEMKANGISKVADIIICDGGSSDGSTNLEYLKDQEVRVLLVKTGQGKQGAQLRMGYSYALQQGYQGIVTIDGNNKDNTDAIPRFIQALKEGVDFVQGSRYVPGGKAINTPPSRHYGMKLLHVPLISLGAGYRYTDTTNGFRAYSRRLLIDPRLNPFREVFTGYELLAYMSVRAPRLGYKVKELPVIRQYPAQGKIPTKIGGWRGNLNLIMIVLKAITGQYNPQG